MGANQQKQYFRTLGQNIYFCLLFFAQKQFKSGFFEENLIKPQAQRHQLGIGPCDSSP